MMELFKIHVHVTDTLEFSRFGTHHKALCDWLKLKLLKSRLKSRPINLDEVVINQMPDGNLERRDNENIVISELKQKLII
jgi:hypothetical protein